VTLTLVVASLTLLLGSALAASLAGRRDRLALAIGSTGGLAGCASGVVAAGVQLADGGEAAATAPWRLPLGSVAIGLDALSAFFLICVFVVAALAATYGAGYLRAYLGRRRLAPAVAWFNVLVAAMVGLIVARDAVLFLVAWEVMTIASFFLVTFEDERETVRRAGLTYLIASQLGAVALLVLFGLLWHRAGDFTFAAMAAAGAPPPGLAAGCFVLALVGFGTKVGFWPLHVWLPDAHPAAPSHVSALMSGVMIKMGIYGLLRILGLLGTPPVWWGALVVGVGVVSGVAGVLYALAQHDLKRLLAYHSVENIGIVALGIGVGLLGRSYGDPAVSFLGFAGALLHVLNHGLFKGLLFQGAGSVIHATGLRDLDALGGLGRRMPVTAWTFMVGAAAISGLPPLNGFVSEWLILVGAFRGAAGLAGSAAIAAAVVLPALALIGGLAVACFVKVFGVVFLGVARSEAAARAHESGPAMRVAMVLGAGSCVLLGLAPAWAVGLVAPVAEQIGGRAAAPDIAVGALPSMTLVAALLAGAIAVLVVARMALLRGRPVRVVPTWACGYPRVTPRMQYTAASFAEPVLAPFGSVLHRTVHAELPSGYFPAGARYDEHVADMAGERLLVPAVRRVVGMLGSVRVLQQGRLQLYLAYVLVTLLVLLVWQVGVAGR
jgi:hydrogenase-4 component B